MGSRKKISPKSLALTLGAVTLTALSLSTAQAQFTGGNLVVSVINNANSNTTLAGSVTLREYTTGGTTTGSSLNFGSTAVASGNRALTLTKLGTTEGGLTVTGNYLSIAGYNQTADLNAVGTADRVVGVVDWTTGVADTSTILTGYTTPVVRSSVVSADGTQIYATGGGSAGMGVLSITKGSTSPTQVVSNPSTGTRRVSVYNSQLYIGSAQSGFVGVGKTTPALPTSTGATDALLFTDTGGSPYDFYFADASTLFIADDGFAAGGVQKWTKSAGGTWSLKYTVATPSRGLTGFTDATGKTTLYAIANVGQVFSVVDPSLSNAVLPTKTNLFTPAGSELFRGIALLPLGGTAVPEPGSVALFFGLGVVGAGFLKRRKH